VTVVSGSYPFGQPLRAVVQQDRTPKQIFVLGVYASAVHARWLDSDGKVLIRALAVASEPVIFWNGIDAEQVVSRIPLPDGAGTLEAADAGMNGPSGRALDKQYLDPLGCRRSDVWLCDLVPHTCMNRSQARALEREYVHRAAKLGLPHVDLPALPKTFAGAARQEAVLAEFEESGAETIVLLGDEPIRHWLKRFDSRWSTLGDFGASDDEYGRHHVVTIAGRRCEVLPLVHPRQAAGLGSHSAVWRTRHTLWLLRVTERARR
jgi:uracil-DNA glycosylase